MSLFDALVYEGDLRKPIPMSHHLKVAARENEKESMIKFFKQEKTTAKGKAYSKGFLDGFVAPDTLIINGNEPDARTRYPRTAPGQIVTGFDDATEAETYFGPVLFSDRVNKIKSGFLTPNEKTQVESLFTGRLLEKMESKKGIVTEAKVPNWTSTSRPNPLTPDEQGDNDVFTFIKTNFTGAGYNVSAGSTTRDQYVTYLSRPDPGARKLSTQAKKISFLKT